MKVYRPTKEKLYLFSGRGWRTFKGKKKFHRGYDYIPPAGYNPQTNPVYLYPTKKQRGIATVKWKPTGFGNMVEIRYADNTGCVLAHMYKVLVKNGAEVDFNTRLGIIGKSGLATGYHYHHEEFKVWLDDVNKRYTIYNTSEFTYMNREEFEVVKLQTGAYENKKSVQFKIKSVVSKLNIRKLPTTDSEKVGVIGKGQKYATSKVARGEKISGNNTWYLIEKKNGVKGWVAGALVKKVRWIP